MEKKKGADLIRDGLVENSLFETNGALNINVIEYDVKSCIQYTLITENIAYIKSVCPDKFKIKDNTILAKKEDLKEFEEFRNELDKKFWVSPVRWTPVFGRDYSCTVLLFDDKHSENVPHITEDEFDNKANYYYDYHIKKHFDFLKDVCLSLKSNYHFGWDNIEIPIGFTSLDCIIETAKKIDEHKDILVRDIDYYYDDDLNTYIYRINISPRDIFYKLNTVLDKDVDEFVEKCCLEDGHNVYCDKERHIVYADHSYDVMISNISGVSEHIQQFVNVSELWCLEYNGDEDELFKCIEIPYFNYDYMNTYYKKLRLF